MEKGPSSALVYVISSLELHFYGFVFDARIRILIMLFIKNVSAFFLADNGYDVWLGNLRGNAYSSKHVNRTVNNRDYWNFG